MNNPEINIKNKILQFVLTVTASIFLTIGYLAWMSHETYFSQNIITKQLIPNVKYLNEVKSDVLALVSDVRECVRAQDLYHRDVLLSRISLKQNEILTKIKAFNHSAQGTSESDALGKNVELNYLMLKQHIAELLSQLSQFSKDNDNPDLINKFSPVLIARTATIEALDDVLKFNLSQTELQFNDLEHKELSSIGLYLISIFVLITLLYFAGQRTCKGIISLLGSEPGEFIHILNCLLEGKQVAPRDADESSLISKLKESILFDKETGTLNKLGFLQNFHLHFQPEQNVVAVLIKIQGLEELADFIGPANTGTLLNQFTSRLKENVANQGLIARVTNSSFLWVKEDAGDNPAIMMEIGNLLERLQNPYKVGIRNIKLKTFAGIVSQPHDGQNFKLLIPHATIAALKAEAGLKDYMFFTPGFLQESLDYVELETALSHALENREFEVYLQPQVEISSGKISGAEALLRWKHPEKGFIPPDKFIPVAERNGQILEIGSWILNQCIAYAVEINSDAKDVIPIAINISSHQIQANQFFETLNEMLLLHRCHPTWIKLEITESVLLDKNDEVLKTLLQIASLGIIISLDDFGTGYSSLSYLTKYPISQIKIDRTFMSDIPLHLDNTELVKAIIKLAEILHFEVVAEGIESLEQLNFLKNTSCSLVQGYYFYKPMPYVNFRAHLGETTQLESKMN